MACLFSRRAERDLDLICDYIATDYPGRALSFVEEMRARCIAIADMPKTPRIIATVDGMTVRRVLLGRYAIYYTWIAAQQSVVILHIRHDARTDPDWR